MTLLLSFRTARSFDKVKRSLYSLTKIFCYDEMAPHNDNYDDAVRSMKENFTNASEQGILRFLTNRNYNVAKATAMYQAHLDWRQETLPKLERENEPILETLATRKFYLLDNHDSERRPVVVYCLRRFLERGYDGLRKGCDLFDGISSAPPTSSKRKF